MKSKITKISSLIICAAMLAACCAGVTVFAANSAKNNKNNGNNDKTSIIVTPDSTADADKNETVYVIADADGSVRKIIVSDWIKNNSGSATITDGSTLNDVVNVKGDETYTVNGNARVWDARGNDIYISGTTDRELPVTLSVSCTLDGKPISASDLAGKSGKVVIRFDYKNNLYETVEIDGKKEKIYVPFAMLTGVLLDGEKFSNIEVSNGKLINDGDRTFVIGLALPELGNNLGIPADKYEIPDHFEITADVKDFSMTNTVTVAVGDLFGKINTAALDGTDINDAVGKLTDAMTQLTDGSSALCDGLKTLLEKSGELAAGIDQLAEGTEKLKDGAGKLADGTAALSSGTRDLAGGLGALSSNSNALRGGAATVFDSLLATANSQLEAAGLEVPALTRDNYQTVLSSFIASLDETAVRAKADSAARAAVEKAVNAQKDEITAQVTAAVRTEVNAKVTEAVKAEVQTKVLAAMGMTREQYEAGVSAGVISEAQAAQINAAVEAQMQSAEVSTVITANTDAKMQSEEITALIASKTEEQVKLLVESNMKSDAVAAQINAAVEKAAAGKASIVSLCAQLDSYNEFYRGLCNYTAGVDSAKAGADKLSGGAAEVEKGAMELKAGIGSLTDGIITVKNGMPALTGGVSELSDGAAKLADGLKDLNDQGIKKITDAVNGDIAGLMARIRATADVSRDYKSFTGLSDGMDGQVKFIYRTDSIEK